MPNNRLYTLFALALLSLAFAIGAKAQTDTHGWEEYYYQLGQLEDMESDSWEALYDILSDQEGNKLDINRATREDLERLAFLSPTQVEEICEYLYKYAPMRTLGELAMIESLDAVRRNLLSCFVYIADDADKKPFPRFSDILKHGKSELVAAAKVPMYDRKGDRNGYLGYKYKHWLRYTYKLGQYVQAGVTASQDSGEPFFAGRNKWGYDYYSYYLLVRKLGAIKALALGRYRMRIGMGLVLNNDYSFGKAFSLANATTANTIRAHSSRSEATYLQGAAATVTLLRGLDATAFVSYRDIDATPGKQEDVVTTLLQTGYHRTETEMAHKHNVSEFAAGASLRYAAGGFHVGVAAVHVSLDKTLSPDTRKAFRRYYLSGRHFGNASVYYGYNHHRVSLNGETAIDDHGALATINRATWQASGNLSLTVLQRFYSYKYKTFFGECFSDGGRVQNESGAYLGTTWTPLPGLTVMAYTDYAYFAWPKYQVSFASHSWDNMLSATYQKGPFTLNARYRLRMRQRDNSDQSALTTLTEQRARLALGYDAGGLSVALQGDVSHSRQTEGSFGWMLTARGGYKHRWLSAYATVAYFHTDDYASRLYAYEKGLLYTFSFPMFYGQGIRYAANVRVDFSRKLVLICKAGTTKYFDRDTISSSYQQIDGSSMTDLEAQVKWVF